VKKEYDFGQAVIEMCQTFFDMEFLKNNGSPYFKDYKEKLEMQKKEFDSRIKAIQATASQAYTQSDPHYLAGHYL